MQEFIPDSRMFAEIETAEAVDFEERHREGFMKMWVFDLIIGNVDRHDGNFLVSGDALYAIDHGHSLDHNQEDFLEWIRVSSGYNRFFEKELPAGLVESIRKFLDNFEYQQILEDLLRETIGKKYAAACLKRIRLVGNMIVQTGKISENEIYSLRL